MSKMYEGEAPSPDLTMREAYLLELMGKAIEQRRIHPDSPTFTARALAAAMDDISRTMNRIGEREVGRLLDRMGIFLNTRTYRRATETLTKALPEWLKAAEEEMRRIRESVRELPTFPPLFNNIR